MYARQPPIASRLRELSARSRIGLAQADLEAGNVERLIATLVDISSLAAVCEAARPRAGVLRACLAVFGVSVSRVFDLPAPPSESADFLALPSIAVSAAAPALGTSPSLALINRSAGPVTVVIRGIGLPALSVLVPQGRVATIPVRAGKYAEAAYETRGAGLVTHLGVIDVEEGAGYEQTFEAGKKATPVLAPVLFLK